MPPTAQDLVCPGFCWSFQRFRLSWVSQANRLLPDPLKLLIWRWGGRQAVGIPRLYRCVVTPPEANCLTRERAVFWFEKGEKCINVFRATNNKWLQNGHKKLCNVLGSHLVCVWMWLAYQSISRLCASELVLEDILETNSMLPLVPSQLPLSHWCLHGASGPRLWLWSRDTPSLIRSLLQTRTRSLTADTSTLQHKSWFLSAKCALYHEPLVFSSGSSTLLRSEV